MQLLSFPGALFDSIGGLAQDSIKTHANKGVAQRNERGFEWIKNVRSKKHGADAAE